MGTSVEHGSHSFKWSLLLPLLETEYWDRKMNPLGQLSWSYCLYTSRQFLNACKLLTFTVCSTNVFHSFVNGAYFYVFLITLSFTPLMLWKDTLSVHGVRNPPHLQLRTSGGVCVPQQPMFIVSPCLLFQFESKKVSSFFFLSSD